MLTRRKLKKKVNIYNSQSEMIKGLSKSIEQKLLKIKEIFNNDDTLIIRYFENQYNTRIKCCIIFIEGMVDNQIINQNIIQPIVSNTNLSGINVLDDINFRVIYSNNIVRTNNIEKIIENILIGGTVFLLDGVEEVLLINTQGWESRNITEPEGEKVLRGPREGFTESLTVNLSLIRRKILNSNLKFEFKKIGRTAQCKICICYIEGITNQKILKELHNRLDSIDIDAILGSNYIQELIKDAPLTPFKTIGSTERPDIVAAKLLEGRIAIVVDGSPVALTIPHIFVELLQSNEDYYLNYYFASINRVLRILGSIITITIPGIYVALTTFHQEMVPTPLILSITAARQGVPFPTILEAFLLIMVFEILRETGTRMPTYIGQALSIVGALVIGTAAVDARFVSAPMVIIVALSGITGLMIPKLKGAIISLRILFLFLSSFLGLYGLMFGYAGLLIHLFELRTFGVPYMSTLMFLDLEDLKDTAIRMPWWYMKYRPKFIASNNIIRKSSGGKEIEKK